LCKHTRSQAISDKPDYQVRQCKICKHRFVVEKKSKVK
jgi:hypothetical protein